jgi:hypothetical protein
MKLKLAVPTIQKLPILEFVEGEEGGQKINFLLKIFFC